MSHTEFTTTTNEFIGTAAGHTIGMVIPNIDPEDGKMKMTAGQSAQKMVSRLHSGNTQF